MGSALPAEVVFASSLTDSSYSRSSAVVLLHGGAVPELGCADPVFPPCEGGDRLNALVRRSRHEARPGSARWLRWRAWRHGAICLLCRDAHAVIATPPSL